jgi:hypothetical protein
MPTYTAFIDYIKAFDKVIQTKLRIIRRKVFPQYFIRAVQSLYIQSRIHNESREKRSNCPMVTDLGVN